MRWLLLVCAAGCSEFDETLYVHVNDAVSVTVGDKTYVDDFEIDRTFSAEDDAVAAHIPVVIHFADGDLTRYIGTTCPELAWTLWSDGPSWEQALCSFYMTNHTDDPTGDHGEGMNFDCGCTDSDGNIDGYSSAHPPDDFF